MRRCWDADMWEASGMWDVGRGDVRPGEASIGRCRATHFGKGAADINLLGRTDVGPVARRLSYA